MGHKVRLDGVEYDAEGLSNKGTSALQSLEFVDGKILELNNTLALFVRAKKSYMKELQNEILAGKAGFLLNDE